MFNIFNLFIGNFSLAPHVRLNTSIKTKKKKKTSHLHFITLVVRKLIINFYIK